MANDVDVAIVGGGIIGLAIARELSLQTPTLSIALIEKEKKSGTGISSRNSEVIHAGLYYPKTYLKSSLCVRGREQLYQYCREHQVPHKKIGKIVVANTDAEHEFLHALALRAEYNGVDDLVWLTRSKISSMEPALAAKGAFLSPSTGIMDVACLAQSLEKEVRSYGVDVALNTHVLRIEPQAQGFSVVCTSNDQLTTTTNRLAATPDTIQARALVNATGLHAVNLATKITGFPVAQLPSMVLAKGDYFSYRGNNPFHHLIYPVPFGQPLSSPNAQHTGLGIHATIDLQNQLRFGPDLEIVASETYQVDENKRDLFAATIRQYFPALDQNLLQPAYAGIRPRLVSSGTKTPDFLIQTHDQHGMNGLINLFGIESPGLTCCLSIAQQVAKHLGFCQNSSAF